MPSVYAHERFGRQVLTRLPAPVKAVAEKHQRQFGIGLQGPDFLFFYRAWKSNPVSELGFRIHRTPAAELFSGFREMLRKRKQDSMEMACVMGTICHFMLDSSCHWFVEAQMEETKESHNTIETEFERFLMEKDGLDPLRFPVWKLIPADRDTAGCLARLYRYGRVDARTAERCLKDMRLVKRVLSASTPAGQKLLRRIIGLTGHYEEFQGHLMALEPNLRCGQSSRKLLQLSEGAVEETAALIAEFFENIRTDMPLNGRFDRDFE